MTIPMIFIKIMNLRNMKMSFSSSFNLKFQKRKQKTFREMFTTSSSMAMPTSSKATTAVDEVVSGSTAATIFDPLFGIRISNPKVSLETMDAFCSDMRKLRLGQLSAASIQQQQNGGGGEDWVTMGVLVERSECKKSANGNEFMIWRVSDLKELNAAAIKVLLFGDCVRQYWKLQPGNTILLNNPQCADNGGRSENNNKSSGYANANELTLKVFKIGQIIEIGFCPDFGQCQGRKASDGTQCTHFINKSLSLYCPFHLQQRARQVSANRGTLNRSANLPPKQWRQFREPRAADEQQPPPGLTTLSHRHSTRKSYTMPNSMVQRGLKRKLAEEDPAVELEKMSAKAEKLIEENPCTFGSKNLRIMRRKQQKENTMADPKMRAEKPSPSATAKLHSMREFIKSQVNVKVPQKPPLVSSSDGSSHSSSALISKPKRTADLLEQLKIKKAAQILRNKNADGNFGGKQQINQNGTTPEVKTATRSSNSLLGASFTEEQIRALLAKKSAHEEEEGVQDEIDRQNAYFNRGELDEQVETNATNLMEIKGCKVVTCKECDYTSIHQSAYCKSQGHQVKRHSADKRFFKCADCQRRTFSFDRMPTKPCEGCKSMRFSRVAMRDERKVLLEAEKLKIKEEENNFSTSTNN